MIGRATVLTVLACAALAAGQDTRPVSADPCTAAFTTAPHDWQAGPTFIVGVEDWPHLGDAAVRQDGARWPGWSYGKVVVPGAPQAETRLERTSHTQQSYVRSLGEGKSLRFIVSRVSPALRIEAEAPALEFFTGMRQQWLNVKDPQPAMPKYVGFASRYGLAVKLVEGTVNLEDMAEPWMLFWFAEDSPVRPNCNDWGWGPAGVVVGEEVPVSYKSDRPWLVILTAKAKELEKLDDGVIVRFADQAGTVLMTPFHGHRFSGSEETESWSIGYFEQPAERARMLTRRLLAWPAEVSESWAADEAAGKIRLDMRYRFETISTAWQTAAEPLALLPPLLAVERSNPAGLTGTLRAGEQTAALVDLQTPTCFGPLQGVEGEGFTVEFDGLRSYVWQEAAAPSQPAADVAEWAKARLATQVDRMLAAGPLRPLWVVAGRSGPQSYWTNPADTVVALCEALPHLSADRQAKLKAYLADYVTRCDPLRLQAVDAGQGAARQWHAAPDDGPPAAERPDPPPWNLYAAWLYAERTGDWPYVTSRAAQAKAVIDALERQGDWLSFGPIDRPEWAPARHTDDLNARLAGLIGYCRLMRRLDRPEEVARGECLFAKLAVQRIGGAELMSYYFTSGQVEGPPNRWGLFDVAPQHVGDARLMHLEVVTRLDKFGPMLHAFSQQGQRGRVPAMAPLLNLTPEVARLLADAQPARLRAYLESVDYSWPTWFATAAAQRYGGQNVFNPPLVAGPGFLAKAWIEQAGPERLRLLVDVPAAQTGDLEYIRKLAALLGRCGAEQ